MERQFEVGDSVYLKLVPYQLQTLSPHSYHKLQPRYYGPYEICEKAGNVAYKLNLPSSTKIHPVFQQTLTLVQPASASELLPLNEPSNALSLPTWAIHVSSVVEWITAMALVWQYGEKSGFESWKGLSWGCLMVYVPLLGGALCACTWHFFYNSESLEVLVALQAALTVIGNATMCIAAYRIYRSSERSKNL
ncbi:uncharacterized protein [Pyrus communis]|uniref:uncharacterized protein n=1 Tax=Pyrus communis TaxID=23211 RepID=UPI0035C1EDFE